MESSLEQRYVIKFCSKLNKSLAETHKLIVQAYGGNALSYSQVSRWLKAFKGRGGRRTPRPSTSTIRPVVRRNSRHSQNNCTRTGKLRKVCAKLVTDDQKNHRVTELLKRVEIEPHFLGNVITGDETCHPRHRDEGPCRGPSSRTHTVRGRVAGESVWMPKGTTSKNIK
ncbi:hypothetical protein J437_LFUL017633, partial [Ladona fulva]